MRITASNSFRSSQAVRPSAARRRGLAPMELVLWLPILLMVMALMVVIGNGAVWKLRTAAVARDAVWSTRSGRNGDLLKPQNVPTDGVLWAGAHAPIAQLNDPRIDREVVRGPMFENFRVNRDLLDFSRGTRIGYFQMSHNYPMLGKLGRYNFEVFHPLLDDQFRYWEMQIPTNRYRRIPFIYELPKADPQYAQAFASAAQRLLSAPFRPQLRPLDRDEEIYAWYGYYVDFHPRMPSFCSLDYQSVHADELQDLIDHIEGEQMPPVPSVPEVMESFFQNMYREMAQAMQN
ncbi:MAG: pilus assembly protein [Planctomycetia bacterium]|nr:pilus assembly protein [Planctomycetia bacterium]